MSEQARQVHIATDLMDPSRAAALQAALGHDTPTLRSGDALPPFFHHVYFWEVQPAKRLGRDGHPAVGQGLVPDFGLPRRMWAGGDLSFHAPLLLGQPAEKTSWCEATEEKAGRTGRLAFVSLRHEIRQRGVLCVSERQDLVYREDHDPTRLTPEPPRAPSASAPESIETSSTLLFRYSALTMNGHRIHYDQGYAKDTEGYADLVVHGPLLAQLAMLRAQRRGRLRGFRFRGRSALTLGTRVALHQKGAALWVATVDGVHIMEATARWDD